MNSKNKQISIGNYVMSFLREKTEDDKKISLLKFKPKWINIDVWTGEYEITWSKYGTRSHLYVGAVYLQLFWGEELLWCKWMKSRQEMYCPQWWALCKTYMNI